MKIFGCILPGGNQSEFPELEEELKRRGINYEIVTLRTSGAIFLIKEDQLTKLPHDAKGPYLGDDDSGHSIYPMTREDVESFKVFSDKTED